MNPNLPLPFVLLARQRTTGCAHLRKNACLSIHAAAERRKLVATGASPHAPSLSPEACSTSETK